MKKAKGPKPTPSQDVLKELVHYDEDTGFLYFLWRRDHWFPSGSRLSQSCLAAKWNAAYAGKRADRPTGCKRYRTFRTIGGSWLAHRIVWKIKTGEEPEVIDHINGDGTDNRFENLRSVSTAENCLNQRVAKSSPSGVPGVRQVSGRWQATIRKNHRTRYLGAFHRFEDAVAARKAAEKDLGFHENHGSERPEPLAPADLPPTDLVPAELAKLVADEAAGLRLHKIVTLGNGSKTTQRTAEDVIFNDGRVSVLRVLNRASICGRVAASRDGRFWAEQLNQDGEAIGEIGLERESWNALKARWMPCRIVW